jgi:phenylalanyl-tRNA synthetase beta chain
MKQRLSRSGQRSVSALVDISNYVMLELGQPSHVFDLAKIHGGLEVRWGTPGESLELLNGNIVDVDEEIGVIADDSRIESLAGIMGGNATAVSLDTRDIYLEAAFWLPQAIQGRARRYNFSTDAAHRFERGVDYGATAASFERVTRLIVDICGSEQTRVGPVDDQIVNVPEARSVAMRVARATKVIGVDIEAGTVAEIFKRLSFSFTREPDRFVVDPPSYRFDIAVEEDLIEEVARCHGYENVPANLPVAQHTMRAQPEGLASLHAIREQLAMLDYQETLNYSFVDPSWESDFAGNTSPLTLLNPIASQLAVMRTTLIGSLVANVRYNLNRKATRVRMFEIAKVYLKNRSIPDDELKVGGIDQPTRVAAIAYGQAFDEQWGTATQVVDFFDVKNDLESLFAPRLLRFDRPGSAAHAALHPGRSARVILDGESIGWIGELHPRWIQKYEIPQAPVIFEIDAASLQRRVLQQTREVSRFPGVTRDLAFVVDEAITAQRMFDVIDAVRAQAARVSGAARHVQNAVLFDQYRGKGLKDNTKSLAFRFQLQDTDRTLDDQTIEHALADVIRALTSEVGAVLRT